MHQVLIVHSMQEAALTGAWQAAQVVERVAGLVERARAAGTPVVWVRPETEDRPVGSEGWQLVDALVPLEGEPVIDNRWADPFTDPELVEFLVDVGPDSLVVCGADALSLPVLVLSALDSGVDVTLAADAITSADLAVGLPGQTVVGVVKRMLARSPRPDVETLVAPAADIDFTPVTAVAEDLELSEELLAEQDADED